MSDKKHTIDLVEDILNELHLNEVYGIIQGEGESKSGRKFKSLTFCKARILDGSVAVYSPTFLLVTWQTAIRDMPHRGSQVCKSLDELRSFLNDSFCHGKY
jgi:hypothetical protein